MSTDVIAPARLLPRRMPDPLHRSARPGAGRAGLVALTLAAALAAGADNPRPSAAARTGPATEATAPAPTARSTPPDLRLEIDRLGNQIATWYRSTPPMERVAWGGLVACALLGLVVTIERTARVRRSRVIPEAFVERFQRRLGEGGLERGKALDYCELNPSPAARVALAAVRRWGRPTTDLERGVALARQVEVDALRRHVGTLRRVAAMAPLVGLLGTLTAAGRILSGLAPGMTWGPALAGALAPLTAGVGLALVALLAFDGLTVRAEVLAGDLERIGAETIDAVALATPPPAPPAAGVRGAAAVPEAPGLRVQVGHPPAPPLARPPHYTTRYPISRKADGR